MIQMERFYVTPAPKETKGKKGKILGETEVHAYFPN